MILVCALKPGQPLGTSRNFSKKRQAKRPLLQITSLPLVTFGFFSSSAASGSGPSRLDACIFRTIRDGPSKSPSRTSPGCMYFPYNLCAGADSRGMADLSCRMGRTRAEILKVSFLLFSLVCLKAFGAIASTPMALRILRWRLLAGVHVSGPCSWTHCVIFDSRRSCCSASVHLSVNSRALCSLGRVMVSAAPGGTGSTRA